MTGSTSAPGSSIPDYTGALVRLFLNWSIKRKRQDACSNDWDGRQVWQALDKLFNPVKFRVVPCQRKRLPLPASVIIRLAVFHWTHLRIDPYFPIAFCHKL